jgi:hypothetical protein
VLQAYLLNAAEGQRSRTGTCGHSLDRDRRGRRGVGGRPGVSHYREHVDLHESPVSPAQMNTRELIAGNLRRLCAEAGARVADLVPSAKAHGLDWTPAWLAAVEKGNRALSADQLLALPVVLSAALRYRVTLADLLAGDAPVSFAADPSVAEPSASVPAAYLRDVVTGTPVPRPFARHQPPPPAGPDATARAAQRLREITRAGLGDVDIRALARAERGAGAAEARLARRLAVPTIAVVAAAASLWGRSLTEEQADRLTAGEPAATVARRLAADLTGRLRMAREAAQAPAGPAPVESL